MKNVSLLAALTTFSAFTAGAMPADIDTNGDGKASLSELQVANPRLDQDVFNEMDTDDDGLINDEELAIAIELDILVDPDTDA